VSFLDRSGSLDPTIELKMTHCTECSLCTVRGTTRDIVMHERLEHGLVAGYFDVVQYMDPISAGGQGPIMIPEAIQPAEEIVQLLSRRRSSMPRRVPKTNI
jgi:hypothetical protein